MGVGPDREEQAVLLRSFEEEADTQPGTTFRANTGGEAGGGQHDARARVRPAGALRVPEVEVQLRNGPVPRVSVRNAGATRSSSSGDYNINQSNKVSVRYNQLDSNTDVLLSNSSSLGFGNRRINTNVLNFENSNYQILENIRSVIGEWNSAFGGNMSNSLIVGYTKQDESRGDTLARRCSRSIDILKDGVDLHVDRLRAVHAEQRAALQHVPGAGQLHRSSGRGTR